MIKNLHILSLLTVALFFSSCSSPDVVTGLTISVDKSVIESDGKDMAVFTVRDIDGNVLTTEENLGAITFKNVATGYRLPRYSEGFTSIADGEYEFVGIYGGVETVNSVKITSSNRKKYEIFHRNVALFKLTGTWCTACPGMTAALHSLDDDAKAHSVILACHNEDSGHPFLCGYGNVDLATAVFLHMDESVAAYPSLCYDMSFLDKSQSTLTISNKVMERRIEAPAAVGIKINSMVHDEQTLKVSVSVKASASGDYDMVCALLADDCQYAGGTAEDGMYDDVVLAVSGENLLTYRPASLFHLDENGEESRTLEISVPSTVDLTPMKVVVLVHKKEAFGSSINNCVVCPWGETLDYIYN